jgi:hypothetical protein
MSPLVAEDFLQKASFEKALKGLLEKSDSISDLNGCVTAVMALS